MVQSKSISKRKSARLSKSERNKLSRFISKCTGVSEAAEKLGVPRYVLDDVRIKGSASPANIEIIKRAIAA